MLEKMCGGRGVGLLSRHRFFLSRKRLRSSLETSLFLSWTRLRSSLETSLFFYLGRGFGLLSRHRFFYLGRGFGLLSRHRFFYLGSGFGLLPGGAFFKLRAGFVLSRKGLRVNLKTGTQEISLSEFSFPTEPHSPVLSDVHPVPSHPPVNPPPPHPSPRFLSPKFCAKRFSSISPRVFRDWTCRRGKIRGADGGYSNPRASHPDAVNFTNICGVSGALIFEIFFAEN